MVRIPKDTKYLLHGILLGYLLKILLVISTPAAPSYLKLGRLAGPSLDAGPFGPRRSID